MPTTLTKGATVVTLPDDLVWRDEFDWRTQVVTRSYSIGGALITDSVARLAGRPMTLVHDGVARSVVLQLAALADQSPGDMTLVHLGVSHTVQFAYDQSPLQAAQAFAEYADPAATDEYSLTLRLIKVA